MLERPFWIDRIEAAWREAPIAWLSGVRRAGKTTLAGSLRRDGVLYLDCDSPAVRERVRDPELFFRECGSRVLVFDEVHRLEDPSQVLKIGADHFPGLRILATGPSTIAASGKFRDTLTGRKRTVHLLPVLLEERAAFGATLGLRLIRGGLPEALLGPAPEPAFYREWMDSFFARDIQHLFGLRDIEGFNALFEYLLRQSGGILGKSRAARELGISRPTLDGHLRALETCHAVTRIRPFHGGRPREVTGAPKVYGFDTGFVAFARGWDSLRTEDQGILWEHLVLETLQARLPLLRIGYWRDRSDREVDFVLPRSRDSVDAVECRWNPANFDPAGLRAFRALHPKGRNYVVGPGVETPYPRRYGDLVVRVCRPEAIP